MYKLLLFAKPSLTLMKLKELLDGNLFGLEVEKPLLSINQLNYAIVVWIACISI